MCLCRRRGLLEENRLVRSWLLSATLRLGHYSDPAKPRLREVCEPLTTFQRPLTMILLVKRFSTGMRNLTQKVWVRRARYPLVDLHVIEYWYHVRGIVPTHRCQDDIFVLSQAHEDFLRCWIDFEGLELIGGHLGSVEQTIFRHVISICHK